uniref:Immunoglobulin V-set domain-containing protein n=1 Tax=Larimichthys crocea TaxID=215358 RepID=A0A0F8BN76_LARCR
MLFHSRFVFFLSVKLLGVSYNREYGQEFKIVLLSVAHYIEFNHMDSSDQTLIVWKRDDPPAREDSRRKVVGIYFVIKNLTQLDSGLYTVRGKKGRKISTKSLVVSEIRRTFIRGVRGKLRVGFDLEPNSCNIYFFPEKKHTPATVARRGKLLETLYCPGLMLLWPCELENNNLDMSCSGRFEFRDLNDNKALVVTLKMKRK